MRFSIQDFFSKCDQIRSFLRIWSYLLKKSLMENFIFCAANAEYLLFLLTGPVLGQLCLQNYTNHAGNYLLNVSNKNTRLVC